MKSYFRIMLGRGSVHADECHKGGFIGADFGIEHMGFVRETLAEDSQEVKGVIVALEDDLRTRRALSVTPNVEFYRYHINFTLTKVDA